MPQNDITNRDLLKVIKDLKAEFRTGVSEVKQANAEMVYSICRTAIWLLVFLSVVIIGTALVLDVLNVLE